MTLTLDDPTTNVPNGGMMESTPVIVVYAPLILAGVSVLGFAVTVAVLIVGRVFRLGKFFAAFTTLQETVAANHSELQ